MDQACDIKVSVSTEALDANNACGFVTDPANGAIDMFIGVVRDNHLGQTVTGITYDVHETLAERELMCICREAQGIWPKTRYFVSHYHGYLPVGGVSVLIAVSAPHREESFEACRYVIEEIKKRAPVWKKEHYVGGESEWLPGHSLVMQGEEEQAVCCGKCGAHG
ncbi:MAG: molybdenum cofactor biosynthesis protein MoaE [Micavibrio aeruginosavorus]|uniref:Molybdopterin synthase catalytic subunit n=1 Tax=Micavibrio aeruginosavorus TaxID=349221 RepID=A0A7T5R4I5_9BACT|nr:MAG: molybdenum cofactor biosynthesis protein MoaE [Micavibrio aeruginosavorus]